MPRVAIFGIADDPQSATVAAELERLGAEPVLISARALDQQQPASIRDGVYHLDGQAFEGITAAYVRMVPLATAPYTQREDGEFVLFDDWFIRYMQAREREAFYMSWLLAWHQQGVKLVNPPNTASVMQSKPYQLHVLRSLGARIPRTLISNDPAAIREFSASTPEVIFKPVTGGAETQMLDEENLARLDDVRLSPVIFQERIYGDDLRIMLIGDEIVSSVAIRTPEAHLDFRGDPHYSGGLADYEPVELPPDIVDFCRRAARLCGLPFAGIDIKHTPKGEWVFLELNSSPIYLDVERKLGHPISAALARFLIS